MALKIHNDASYFSAPKERSHVGGHLFLGNYSDASNSNMPNVILLAVAPILKHVVSSVIEVEMGALFINMKEAKIIRKTLEDTGCPQHKPTPISNNNYRLVGIDNDTTNKRRSKSMGMRFYWCQ